MTSLSLKVVNALRAGQMLRFVIDDKDIGRLYGITDNAPYLIGRFGLGQFADYVKGLFGIIDNDHVSGDLRSDRYRTKDGKVLTLYGSMGQLEISLTW